MLRSSAPLAVASLLLLGAPAAFGQAPPAPGVAPAPPAPGVAPAPPAPGGPTVAPAPLGFTATATAPMPPPAPAAAPSDGARRRLVRFIDGAAPELVVGDDEPAAGALTIELRFENTNPLCYAYRTNLGASARAPAMPPRALAPLAAPPSGELAAPSSLEDAETALDQAERNLAAALADAERRIALDDVWRACDAGGDLASQSARVAAALAVSEQQAGPGGEWRRAIAQAGAAADAAAQLARSSERAAPPDSDDGADEGAAPSERRARGLPGKVARHAHAVDLRARRATGQLLALIAEVERAAALLRRAPGTVTARLATGEQATVEVTRVALDRGRPAPATAERFTAGPFRALRPIWLDVSVGPALTLRNWREYGVGVRPGRGDDTALVPRVVRTRDELHLDGMVSLSMYVWGARTLDDTLFHWKQLLPRPMIGFSMRQPFTSIYLGGQLDPMKFVDLSAGVRFYEQERLMGPFVGNPTPLGPEGRPVDPVIRRETTSEVFVALTASTDLFARWIGGVR
ncbi:MAG: hypothetical protein OZ921_00730 [Sorangiineae bacterium]|nr:hypothetical protein [Polyangiaceae bacterium]MEB2321008.1 hypothetical protein [Sorangiineae bacterium]